MNVETDMSIVPPEAAGQILLHGISWSAYEQILDALDDRPVRLTYDCGELEIMSPSERHERLKTLIGRLIETLTEELDIPIRSAGSTTLKSQLKQKGLEPDECYYVASEPRVRGKEDIDLEADPPDLAIEVDVTRSCLDRLSIYAALGIPEIWRLEAGALRVLTLQRDGSYLPGETSSSFSFLSISELNRFLAARNETDETSWIRGFRVWVRENLSNPD